MQQPGYHGDKARHLKRLARIEGQVRGISQMVDDDRYCIDVMTQVSATTKALQALALELLGEHVDHCVRDAIKAGGNEADEKITEAMQAIGRLVKS